jgi:hypothetical protein
MDKKIIILLLAALTILAIMPQLGQAQEVGQAFTFSDVSLSPSNLDIYQLYDNSTMVYIMTINSTGGKFVYDPTSNYVVILKPTIANTYGSSPEGIFALAMDNPELAALVIILILFVGFICLILMLIFLFRRS